MQDESQNLRDYDISRDCTLRAVDRLLPLLLCARPFCQVELSPSRCDVSTWNMSSAACVVVDGRYRWC